MSSQAHGAVPIELPAHPLQVLEYVPIDVYRCGYSYTQEDPLRTNIEIDDDLMRKALRASGLKTKRAVVEEGLRLVVRLRDQKKIDRWFGKVKWTGNLDESRQGRVPE